MEREFEFEPTGEMENIPEGATDIEIAILLSEHIDNPCGTEVAPGRVENYRKFYLAQAKKMLSGMTNESAKEMLVDKIREYEPEFKYSSPHHFSL